MTRMKRALVVFLDHERRRARRGRDRRRARPGATATRPGARPPGGSTVEIPNGATAGDVAARLRAAGAHRQPGGVPALRRPARGGGAVQGRALRDRRARDAEADPRRAGQGRRRRARDGGDPRGEEPGRGRRHPGRRRGRRQGRADRRRRSTRRSRPSWACRARRSRGTCSPTPTGCARGRSPARALIPLVRRHRQVFGGAARGAREGGADLKQHARLRRPQDRRPRVDRREGDRARRGATAHRAGVHQPPPHADLRPQAAPDRSDDHLRLHGGDAAVAPPASSGTGASAASSSTIARTPTTRTRTPGLPPGPISNPGRAALEAVMAPDGTPYPLLRRQERRHPPVLAHGRRAQRRGGEVPARRQAARTNDHRRRDRRRGARERPSSRPPAWAQLLRGRFFGRPIEALREVSFTVAPGEIVCVMGPNGAGKSTLVRILGGLLAPSAGRRRIDGIDASAGTPELRRRVAFVVGDERSFHYRVSGRGNLHYFAALHGLSGRGRRGGGPRELLERVGLGDGGRSPLPGVLARHAPAAGDRARPARRSGGAAARRADAGPRSARRPRPARCSCATRSSASAGRTAIVCSNDPSEARALADRVLFLEGGRLRGEASPDRIEAELGL